MAGQGRSVHAKFIQLYRIPINQAKSVQIRFGRLRPALARVATLHPRPCAGPACVSGQRAALRCQTVTFSLVFKCLFQGEFFRFVWLNNQY
jgi:hypothetical protein